MKKETKEEINAYVDAIFWLVLIFSCFNMVIIQHYPILTIIGFVISAILYAIKIHLKNK